MVCLLVAACANTRPADRSTGPDGKVKGALPVVLSADNTATTKGVVTYPGGDRVDWKELKLPEGNRGRFDVQLTFSTPRPA